MKSPGNSTGNAITRRAFVRRAALLAALAAITPSVLSACSSQSGGGGGVQFPFSRWHNSDLVGSVNADTAVDARSDFHVASNHDWLATSTLEDGALSVDAFTEREDDVWGSVEFLLDPLTPSSFVHDFVATDDSQVNASRRAILDAARRFYAACDDTDARAEAGAAPIRPYLEAIENVQTLGQLSSLLCYGSDLAVDPLVRMRVGPGRSDRTRNAVYVAPEAFSLGDPAQYSDPTSQSARVKSANDTFCTSALVALGYTRNVAEGMVSDAYDLERSIAMFCASDQERSQATFFDDTCQELTLAELAQNASRFPLARMLRSLGFDDSTLVVLEQPDWLARLGVLYDVSNLELFKSLLIVNTLERYVPCLDEQFVDLAVTWANSHDGTSFSLDWERNARDLCETFVADLVGAVFLMSYDETLSPQVEALVDDLRQVMLGLVDGSSWLSADGRSGARSKLEALSVYVGHATATPDVSDLPFSVDNASGTLVDWCVQAQHHIWRAQVARLGQVVTDTVWRLDPQQVCVSYELTENALFVPAGIIGGLFFDPARTPAANRGTLGVLMGRELVHAIDRSGSRYGADGSAATWWNSDDDAAYDAAYDMLADYLSSQAILTLRAEDGDRVAGAALADISALQCAEALEASREGDHSTLLLSFASLWRVQMTEACADQMLSTSTVPAGFLRSNVGVQMSSYFYDTFSVGEGDNMYLDPESRITAW
jgi:putative endopeptidase